MSDLVFAILGISALFAFFVAQTVIIAVTRELARPDQQARGNLK